MTSYVLFTMHTTKQWQRIDTSQMGMAADPAIVTSKLDLRHETGDMGSNSILEILQLQCMVMIRYNIYILES